MKTLYITYDQSASGVLGVFGVLGQLTKVGERKVPYRNRPVAEYVPTDMVEASTEPVIGAGWVNLGDALQHWKG